MRQFLCKGGGIVQVTDEDHWLVPYTAFHKSYKQKIDFTELHDEVRVWWRSLLEGAFQSFPPNQVIYLCPTARKLPVCTALLRVSTSGALGQQAP